MYRTMYLNVKHDWHSNLLWVATNAGALFFGLSLRKTYTWWTPKAHKSASFGRLPSSVIPKGVRSGQQCAQTLPLSTRLPARPIWDKTKNKYIRSCDAKMVEALWLAYSYFCGPIREVLTFLGRGLGFPIVYILANGESPFIFFNFM